MILHFFHDEVGVSQTAVELANVKGVCYVHVCLCGGVHSPVEMCMGICMWRFVHMCVNVYKHVWVFVVHVCLCACVCVCLHGHCSENSSSFPPPWPVHACPTPTQGVISTEQQSVCGRLVSEGCSGLCLIKVSDTMFKMHMN